MFSRGVPRLAAALSLVAIVLVALPAAGAGPPGPAPLRPEQSWLKVAASWLGAFWGELGATWRGGTGPHAQESAAPAQCDPQPGSEPDGCTATARGDEGAAIDPDG